MPIKSIKEVENLAGKKVLVRADFNVALKGGKVQDDFRIQQSAPTIKYLLSKGAKVILVSHLGRPAGIDKKLSLRPVAKVLEKMMKKSISFLDCGQKQRDCFAALAMTTRKMKNGEIVMLENIRFFPGEEKNDKKLAKDLASLADIFVLDGFAVAHRDAASVSGVSRYLPAYAGLLLADEIAALSSLLTAPKQPLVLILGGAKAETKIPMLKNLLAKADHVLVGGEIFNTYLWAKGMKVGSSLVDKKYKREILKYCSNKKVVLPVDVVVGRGDGQEAKVEIIDKKFEIKNKKYAVYDIGPATARLFSKHIKGAQTIIWNGAMGKFENHPYEYGTFALAHLFAARSKGKAYGVCGGGETVEVLRKLKLLGDIDLVSTGGGAMLDFLAGKKLPGLAALGQSKGFSSKFYSFINLFI